MGHQTLSRKIREYVAPLGVQREAHRRANANRPAAVFLWIPRTAGTSALESLGAAGCGKFKTLRSVRFEFSQSGLATFGHQAYHQLVEVGAISREYDRAAWKFTFVRNPWDRAVSLYALLRRRSMINESDTFEDFARSLTEKGVGPIGLHNAKELSWLNPQVDWLCVPGQGIQADFVGRFESLAQDFATVCKKLGIETSLGHLNAAPHAHYRDVFTPESRKHVEQFYAEDIETFGYSF